MDEEPARQLRPWPNFKTVGGRNGDASYFANHCPRCGSLQEDMYLHSEPDEPFFAGLDQAHPARRYDPLERR
jgi:hypothetical protein